MLIYIYWYLIICIYKVKLIPISPECQRISQYKKDQGQYQIEKLEKWVIKKSNNSTTLNEHVAQPTGKGKAPYMQLISYSANSC